LYRKRKEIIKSDYTIKEDNHSVLQFIDLAISSLSKTNKSKS
jgi:hypothetical protein